MAEAYAGKTYAGNLFQKVFEDPTGAVKFVLTLFANSALNEKFLMRGLSRGSMLGIGTVIAFFYPIAIVLYFRTKMHQRTYLPIAFILFAAFAVGALLSARFGLEWGFPLRASFASSPQLGLIGMFWIFVYSIQHYWARIRRSKPMALMAAIPFLLLFVVEFTNIERGTTQIWKTGRQLERSARKARIASEVKDPESPEWNLASCKSGGICNDSLTLMFREKLNIFAEGEGEGKARERDRRRETTRDRSE